MGVSREVYVDASFQKRLFECSELFIAEVFLFTNLIEECGDQILNAPGYCFSTQAEGERIRVWVKLLGSWTPLWIAVSQPNVFVLSDR